MKKKEKNGKGGKEKSNFFNEREGNFFKIHTTDKDFGKKYVIDSITKEQDEAFKGTLEKYFIGEECEVSILKTEGKTETEFFERIIPIGKNVIRIIYHLEGECIFPEDFFEIEKKDGYIKQKYILIGKAEKKVENYKISGRNLKFMYMDIHMDRLTINLLKMTDLESIEEWKKKILNKHGYYFEKINLKMKYLLEEIENIVFIKNIEEYFNFKAKIFQILFLIFEIMENSTENKFSASIEIVKSIKKIIEKYLINEVPSVNLLCEISGIKRYSINESFKKVEGIGLAKYIHRKKMEYSRTLLTETDKNISEISAETGYENPSKFSEAFKKYFGVLPNKYKKIKRLNK